jgi:hypothetical protein
MPRTQRRPRGAFVILAITVAVIGYPTASLACSGGGGGEEGENTLIVTPTLLVFGSTAGQKEEVIIWNAGLPSFGTLDEFSPSVGSNFAVVDPNKCGSKSYPGGSTCKLWIEHTKSGTGHSGFLWIREGFDIDVVSFESK